MEKALFETNVSWIEVYKKKESGDGAMK